jgi:FkbM family methyltransferase
MATRLREIFSGYGIQTVIDVGANEGQYRDFLRQHVGFEGRIVSFEPIPALAEKLKQRAAREDPNWVIHACALGAETGTLPLNIMSSSTFSSFLSPSSTGAAQDAKNSIVATIDVPISTLDHELSDADPRHAYLKLDTQGFDLEVLRGGQRLISALPALQTEVSFRALYSNMPDYKTAISSFEAYGFSVADLFLVATDGTHRAVEFDCIMVRA